MKDIFSIDIIRAIEFYKERVEINKSDAEICSEYGKNKAYQQLNKKISEDCERIEILTSILDEEVDKKIERKQFIKKIKEDN